MSRVIEMPTGIKMELKAGAKIVKIWRLLIYMIYLDNHLISFKLQFLGWKKDYTLTLFNGV